MRISIHRARVSSALLGATALIVSITCASLVHAQTSWPAKPLEPNEPPAVRVGMAFGSAVGVSYGRVLVGAPSTDGHGAAYVFSQQGANWPQTQKLLAPDMGAGTFGDRLDVDLQSALISDTTRNLVYYFEKPDYLASPFRATAILRGGTELFGSTVALDGCVGLVASGAHGSPIKKGYVHVYNRCPSGRWTFKGSISAPDATGPDYFGYSIALSSATLMIGAPYAGNRAGAVYFYTYANGAWTLKQKITQNIPFADNQFGRGVGFRNGLAVIGAPNTISGFDEGTLELYKLVNGTWVYSSTQVAPPEAHGTIAQYGAKIQVTDTRVIVSSQPKSFYNMGGSLTVLRRSGDTITFEKHFPPDDRHSVLGTAFDADGQGLVIGDATRPAIPGPGVFGGGADIYQMPP
jgi:hypothetical protein